MWETMIEAIFGQLSKEQRLFVMRSAWIGVVTFHMVWVCGWMAFTGLDAPFARAIDLSMQTKLVSTIADALKQDRIERLDLAIQNVRSQQCRTPADSPSRQNYTDRLNDLFRKYVELTSREPHVPRCDET